LRAGGKHNDLDNVGRTPRHHTFFEMLGNFSFGDYFKETAIELAWNLVTVEYGLSPNRLCVTVYHEDDEAFDLWRKISGLSDDRIIRISTSDNYWSMGDVGPCGPCSEIFYDHGELLSGGLPGTVESEGDRFVEIWNLVFMEFEQQADGTRVPLPKPAIDTGMGIERIAAVLQGVHDNYLVDSIRKLVLASAEVTKTDPDGDYAVSHRVIADHLRAISFLLADGVMPASEGRGYVLRRIMRRAMRHAHSMGQKDPMMWRLVPTLIDEMATAYPELNRAKALIVETLNLEESRFKKTLDRGLRILDDEVAKLGSNNVFPGDIAFKLYDTYGFPLDLTQDVLRNQGVDVDIKGFEGAMEEQRAEARAAWSGSGDIETEGLWLEIRRQSGASEFVGHDTDSAEGRIEKLIVDGITVPVAVEGSDVAIIVNQTPFYAESGGQIGDSGVVRGLEGAQAFINDCQSEADGLHVHFGSVVSGKFAVGDNVELSIDPERRAAIRANHSATHLLHAALRHRLGEHVLQKGSLVTAERMRFDFSHGSPLSREDVVVIEELVNSQIRLNSDVKTRVMTSSEAINDGALALFGEKYGDSVRVLTMGLLKNNHFSVELCGGTHVNRTGDIGAFRIRSDSSLAAGVRRIEALSGAAAVTTAREEGELMAKLANDLNVAPSELESRINALRSEHRQLERDLSDLRRQTLSENRNDVESDRKIVGGRLVARVLYDVPARELKSLVDDMKTQGPGVYVLVGVVERKASLVVGVTQGLVERFDAVELARKGVVKLGGKGVGGRSDMAQGGGSNPAGAQEAIEAIEEEIESIAS